MEYFDASEELHHSIQEYIDGHNGTPPSRLYVSPTLYEWLEQIRREEYLLQGKSVEELQNIIFPTEYGEMPIVIDELLSDYEIVPE